MTDDEIEALAAEYKSRLTDVEALARAFCKADGHDPEAMWYPASYDFSRNGGSGGARAWTWYCTKAEMVVDQKERRALELRLAALESLEGRR
jgi:hypothetical protein